MSIASIYLNRQTNQPLYLQIADQLRGQIETGDLPAEMRLPASRALAKKLGVNRITIVNAYAELEAEGLVTTRMGSGTYVAPPKEALTPPEFDTTAADWNRPLPMRRTWSPNQMVAEMMRLARKPGVISFAGGAPASEFIPVNQFRRALNDVLRRDGAEALQYAEAAGYYPLRDTIAHNLQQNNISVTADDILITAGCQQATDIALRVLADNNDSLLVVEDPCYLGLLDLVTSRNITPLAVPMDEHGMQIDRLEQIILRHRPRLIYVTPSYHNPTGLTMPLSRRQNLLDIAARYGVPVLEDTSYDGLSFQGQPLPTLKSLDTSDIVFHAGGFSKTLVPGIRIGYLVAPPALQERMIATKQTADILTSPLNQRALHAYLSSGHYPEHLATVRQAYQTRRDVMIKAVQKYFPAEAQWLVPHGGIYLWVNMADHGPTATELYLTAINYSVAFSIGAVFSANGTFDHAMRLNFAAHTCEEINEGMRRLGKAWKELLTRPASQTSQPRRRSAMQIL